MMSLSLDCFMDESDFWGFTFIHLYCSINEHLASVDFVPGLVLRQIGHQREHVVSISEDPTEKLTLQQWHKL